MSVGITYYSKFQDLYCVRSDLGNLLKALGRLDEAKVMRGPRCERALCNASMPLLLLPHPYYYYKKKLQSGGKTTTSSSMDGWWERAGGLTEQREFHHLTLASSYFSFSLWSRRLETHRTVKVAIILVPTRRLVVATATFCPEISSRVRRRNEASQIGLGQLKLSLGEGGSLG